jgi:hypothetical protein
VLIRGISKAGLDHKLGAQETGHRGGCT